MLDTREVTILPRVECYIPRPFGVREHDEALTRVNLIELYRFS